MSEKILTGIRVVEMATYIAGPVCARILADWGADVIKLEGLKGDPVRLLGANLNMPVRPDENPLYCLANANKRCFAIDQRMSESKEAVEKLIESADVFVTNYRREALEAMGLSYEQLKVKYPKLVFAHVLGYGDKGPYKDRPGFDFTAYYARGGFMADMADSDGPPTSTAAGYGDNQLAMYLAGGIAGALFNRSRTGNGDYVSVSLYHAAIYGFGLIIAASAYKPLYPTSRKLPATPSSNCYKCSDGEWIMLGCASYPAYFGRICHTIGLTEYAENPDYCTIKGMLQRKAEIVQLFESAFLKKTAAEWDEILENADIPADRLLHFTDIINDEQAWANNFLYKKKYASGNSSTLPTTPVKFNSMGDPDYEAPTGVIGGDTLQILKELGFADHEIEAMRAANAVQ